MRDGGGFAVREADVLPLSRAHQVLTTPPYPIADAKVGVNLRWYLANSQYHKAVAGSAGDPKKVVFLSLHADSLHPSLRGAMIYVPSAKLTGGRSSRGGDTYLARAEVREQPAVEFPLRDRQQSEGLSREMANRTIGAFRSLGLPVHPYKPVRERIIRHRGEFVPAVLCSYTTASPPRCSSRCATSPTRRPPADPTRAFRQQVAEAVVGRDHS